MADLVGELLRITDPTQLRRGDVALNRFGRVYTIRNVVTDPAGVVVAEVELASGRLATREWDRGQVCRLYREALS